MDFSLNLPSNIIFGENTIENLGDKVREFGSKALIVTGSKSTKASGVLDQVKNSLKKAKIHNLVFDSIAGEPDTETVDIVREIVEKENVDFVIGLGGGSALDVAKAAAGLVGQALPTLNYLNKTPFDYKGIPFIAVPTTAGTGSEITLNAVLYNKKKNNKNSLAHPKFQSRLSIIDPTLTYSMSPSITAATGMDALTHAIESYTSTVANPITKALAGQAITLISRSLVLAVEDGMNRTAREDMALGSMMAALAFSQTGVGLAHAISHPLGALFHISHGVANAILLPVVMDYNARDCYELYEEIRGFLKTDMKASDFVKQLVNQLPLPKTLTETGYRKGFEKEMIDLTFDSRSIKKNPRNVEKEDVLMVIKKCL